MRGLNNTQLKILAIIAMTVDHVGAYLLPGVPALRAVGRLAFPIFAYMIVEGCRHTSNKARYLATMCAFGIASQLLYWGYNHTLYQSIFTTLVLSVVTIFSLQWWASGQEHAHADKPDRPSLDLRALVPLAALALDVVATVVLPQVLAARGFYVQYRLPGVLLPVMAYLPWLAGPHDERDKRLVSLGLFAIGLVVVAATGSGANQWWSLCALVSLALYNGERGTHSLKYLFYVYYPLHLAIIMLVARALAATPA